MTAYTSSDAESVFVKQGGEFSDYVVHMTRLDNGDTLDLTPWVNGRKVIDIKAVDHGSTVVLGASSTPTDASEWECSMVVSTDVVTFSQGSSSSDAYVSFRTVPS